MVIYLFPIPLLLSATDSKTDISATGIVYKAELYINPGTRTSSLCLPLDSLLRVPRAHPKGLLLYKEVCTLEMMMMMIA